MKGYTMNIKATSWKNIVIGELNRRDAGMCTLCGLALSCELIEVDHVIEKEHGGLDEMDNLRLVHLKCHRLRHNPNHRTGDYIQSLKDIRHHADLMTLRRLREALVKTKRMNAAAKMCGMTIDQAYYLKRKYKVSKNPLTWKI